MDRTLTTLVLEGGGVKGIAYVGALKAMDEHGVTPGIQRIAGTSAGSVVAALLAAGVTEEALRAIMMELDFAAFQDDGDPLRLASRYGLYGGEDFLVWMRSQLEGVLGVDPTFDDLPKDLHVFATDLTARRVKEFSREATPTVSVAEAVRCSMSIPLFFAAYELDGHLYVDGGAVLNYPFLPFQTPDPRVVLGLHLHDGQDKCPRRVDLGWDDPVAYLKALFETIVNAQQQTEFLLDPAALRQSVRIDDEGIAATDFGLTAAQKRTLYENGYAAASAFLAGGHHATDGVTPTERAARLLQMIPTDPAS